MRGISRGAGLAAVLLTALVVLGSPPAAGQETVEFQLRLARGEILYYTFALTGLFTSQIGDRRQSNTFQADSRQVVRVLGVDDDGTMLVELALEDYRITQGGRS